MSNRPIRLLRDSFPERPELDTAFSRVLLERASAGLSPETLRIHRPGSMVAFGRRDTLHVGYGRAVRAAREGGFEAVERLAGGRAAVFHPQTIAISWSIPEAEPRRGIEGRFVVLAETVVTALRELGVDARIGEVAGEYCPGRYSVSAGGRTKLMGAGQRLVRGAVHVGAVLVLANEHLIRNVLIPVYQALRLDWDPATVGSVQAEVGRVAWDDAKRVLLDAFAARFRLRPGRAGGEVHRLAAQLAPQHRSPDYDDERSIASLAAENENPGSGPPAIT